MAMVAEPLRQPRRQLCAARHDIGQQIVVADHLLHRQRRGTRHRVGLIGLAMHERAGPLAKHIDHLLADQNPANRLIPAAEPLGDHLDIRRNPFLFPGMHRPGPAHAAHHLIQHEQCAMPITHLAHALEVARHRCRTACGGANDGLGKKRTHRIRPESLELGFEFQAKPIHILLVALVVAAEPVGEAGADEAERIGEQRLIGRAPHHVAAGRQRTQRGAVIALAAGNEFAALRLALFQKILPRQLDRGLVAFRAR